MLVGVCVLMGGDIPISLDQLLLRLVGVLSCCTHRRECFDQNLPADFQIAAVDRWDRRARLTNRDLRPQATGHQVFQLVIPVEPDSRSLRWSVFHQETRKSRNDEVFDRTL